MVYYGDPMKVNSIIFVMLFSIIQYFCFSQSIQHSGFSIDLEIGCTDIGIGAGYSVNNSLFFSLNGIMEPGFLTDDVLGTNYALMANIGIGNKYDSFAGSFGLIYFINRYFQFGFPLAVYYRSIFIRFIPYFKKNFGVNMPTGFIPPETLYSFDYSLNIGYSFFLGNK
jgi:hypothetical protein